MGCLLSLVIADIIMEACETVALESSRSNLKFGYDKSMIFSSFNPMAEKPSKHPLNFSLNHHSVIQFIRKVENKNCSPFLDVHLTRH